MSAPSPAPDVFVLPPPDEALAGFATLAEFAAAQRAAQCCAACIERVGLIGRDEAGEECPFQAPPLPDDGVRACVRTAAGSDVRYWERLVECTKPSVAKDVSRVPSLTLLAARALDPRLYGALAPCIIGACERAATDYAACNDERTRQPSAIHDAAALLERWRAMRMSRFQAPPAFAVAFWPGRDAPCALIVNWRVIDAAFIARGAAAPPWWAADDINDRGSPSAPALLQLHACDEACDAAYAYCLLHAGRCGTRSHVHVISSALCAAQVLDAPVASAERLYTALTRRSRRQ